MTKKIKVYPSILSGDFGYLAKEAKQLKEVGADAVHIDVMDGHFVPNLTLGPQAVAAIRRSTDLFLDVHLMIYNPFDYIERFIEAGADQITFHIEATEEVEETLHYIRKCNRKAGLALCPETSVEILSKYVDQCDQILLMTVHPGFGGQKFMPEVLEKISFVKKGCAVRSLQVDIQVDGGIDANTAKACVEQGANVLVSGTYLYKAPDMRTAIQTLRAI